MSAITRKSGGEVTTLAGASNAFDFQSTFDVHNLRPHGHGESLMARRNLNQDIEAVDSKLAQFH